MNGIVVEHQSVHLTGVGFDSTSDIPPQRDSTITSRLRSAAIYPWPATRTKRFTSSV